MFRLETLPEAAAPRVQSGLCEAGEPHSQPVGIYFPDTNAPKIVFYTLLDPAKCLACSTGVLDLQQVGVRMRFPTFCTIALRFSVVEANGDSTCIAPDTTRALWPPFEETFTDVAGNYQDYLAPFPGGSCLSRKAFLRVEIVNTDNIVNPVRFSANLFASCVRCESYWQYPVVSGGGPVADVCELDPGLLKHMAQWVVADCCDKSPARRQSWGQLKQIYR